MSSAYESASAYDAALAHIREKDKVIKKLGLTIASLENIDCDKDKRIAELEDRLEKAQARVASNATECGQISYVPNSYSGRLDKYKCTTMRLADEKLCPDCNPNRKVPCVAQSSQSQVSDATLMDILIDITHHEGALEEFRPRWEPIVSAELKRRLQSIPADTKGGE